MLCNHNSQPTSIAIETLRASRAYSVQILPQDVRSEFHLIEAFHGGQKKEVGSGWYG
jgi:hypothetical protein